MSSNAFARSRPRVRHQRIPRTPTCDHPRFLLLVNELARLNNLKQKQFEGHDTESVCPPQAVVQQSIDQSSTSETCNFTTATPNTSNSQKFHQQHHSSHYSHQPHHNPHQSGYAHNQFINNSHRYHDEPIGCVKSNISTSIHTTTAGNNPLPGFSKPTEQQDSANISDFPSAADLRHDENKSKRKRPMNDSLTCSTSTTSRKGSISGCCSSSNKKFKSDSISSASRPLSPSFTKCPICLLDSIDRDPSFTNTCFHLFCYVCIENWTKNKATCPLCRTDFTKIIYNIKSATSYDEKIARPIRREEDDLLPERFMLEGFRLPNRHDTEVAHFLPHEFLIPPSFLVNHALDPGLREISRSLEPVQTAAGLRAVPRQLLQNYGPVSNYILLNRAVQPSGSAMSSASHANPSLSTGNSGPNSNNSRRSMRNGRYSNRNYEFPQVETARVTGNVNSNNINNVGNFDRNHNQHLHLHPHPHQHQHQHQHQHPHPHQHQHPHPHQHQHQHQHLHQHQHQHQHNQHPQTRPVIDGSRQRIDPSTTIAYNHHPQMVQTIHPPSYMPRSRQYTNQADLEAMFLSNYMPDF